MKSLVEAKLKQKTMFYEEFPKICILVFTSEILPRFFPRRSVWGTGELDRFQKLPSSSAKGNCRRRRKAKIWRTVAAKSIRKRRWTQFAPSPSPRPPPPSVLLKLFKLRSTLSRTYLLLCSIYCTVMYYALRFPGLRM